MTDWHREDMQRGRRYILDHPGISKLEFSRKFSPQFVRHFEPQLDPFFAAQQQPARPAEPVPIAVAKPKGRQKLTKRVKIRHHYWIYSLQTHRLVGKWHGTNKRRTKP